MYSERDYYDDEPMPYYAGGGNGGNGAGQKRTDDKFRRLPCRTFICTGTCPYRERCVYLHDPRIISRNVKSKSRRKNKDDVVSDAWFWPVMMDDDLVVDQSSQPIVNQFYHVPLPRFEQANSHNRSVYSMWMHFVEYCIELSTKPSERATFSMIHSQHQVFCHPDELVDFRSGRKKFSAFVNMYTGEKRLGIFLQLSKGIGIDGIVPSCVPSSVCVEDAQPQISPRSVHSLPLSSAPSPIPAASGVLVQQHSTMFKGAANEMVMPDTPRSLQDTPRSSHSHHGGYSHQLPQQQQQRPPVPPGMPSQQRMAPAPAMEELGGWDRSHMLMDGRQPIAAPEVVYRSPNRMMGGPAVPAESPQHVIKRKLDSVIPPVNTWTKTGAPSGFTLPMSSMSFW